MVTSQKGIDLIKKYESLRLMSYKAIPTEKYYTIGYGHYGADVSKNMVIDKVKAEELLKLDLHKSEKAVEKYMFIYNFTQNEFDALVSFTFNCGSGNLDKLVKNGKRTMSQIADAFLLYTKAGGTELAGLVKRRKEERTMFLASFPKETQQELSVELYTVIKGDSLWSIARKFLGEGIKWTKIYNYNNLTTTNIKTGQVLRIPKE